MLDFLQRDGRESIEFRVRYFDGGPKGKHVVYRDLSHVRWHNLRRITVLFADGPVEWKGGKLIRHDKRRVKAR